jgi:hypothetical protein
MNVKRWMSERDYLPKKPVVRLLKSCGNKVIFLFVFFPLDLTSPRSLRNCSLLLLCSILWLCFGYAQEGIGVAPRKGVWGASLGGMSPAPSSSDSSHSFPSLFSNSQSPECDGRLRSFARYGQCSINKTALTLQRSCCHPPSVSLSAGTLLKRYLEVVEASSRDITSLSPKLPSLPHSRSLCLPFLSSCDYGMKITIGMESIMWQITIFQSIR